MSAQIPGGDLVRLARDGDPVAFRLLVERHQPMARARARSLCGNPSDVDDVMQESFLRAFTGLDRLRDPDRFAGWLGGIVANVGRGLQRRPPVVLLPEWPEPLHPASGGGLPSAEDMDRTEAVRAAVAGLPAGQRRAVALHYYAGLPASQIAEPAGAARASLHKARLRLRAYLIEHRPDLVPAASRRIPMTTVRIAGPERRIPPGPVPIGFPSYVVILADDAGRRALPIWVREISPRRFPQRFEAPAADEEGTGAARTADELTARLLRAAGASVTSVDINDLGAEMPAVARINPAGAGGSQQVTARVAEGLAAAITAGAPVRVADSLMDRLAVALADDGSVPLPDPAATLAGSTPAAGRDMSRATGDSPAAWTDSPSWARRCSPTTTVATWSPSAASSAPVTSRAPSAAPGCSCESSAGRAPACPSPSAPPSPIPATASSRSPATPTGRATRSRLGSPWTPTPLSSASSSLAGAGSRCATRNWPVPPDMLTDAVAGALDALGLRPISVTVLKDDPAGNGNWLVEAPGRRRAVLRRYHPGASPEQIAYEHAVLRHLAAAGWAVPHPVSEPTCRGGRWYCLTRYIPGQPVERESPAQQARRGRDLARLQVALRDLGPRLGQRPGWRPQHAAVTAGVDIDWDACVRGLAIASPRLGTWARAAADRSRDALAAIGAGELPVTVIHGDFAEWNVHYQQGRLAGVIDFGLTHLDSRPYELAIARTYRAPHVTGAYRGELTRRGWPLSPHEEAAIIPLYHAFRLDMTAWELERGLKTGDYDLAAIERQLSRTGTPCPLVRIRP